MFDRKKYKKFAKEQLKSRLGTPILMSLILLGVEFLFQLPGFINFFQSEELWDSIESGSLFYNIDNLSASISYSTPYLLSLVQKVITAIFEIAIIHVYLKMTMSPAQVTLSDFLAGLNNWSRALLAYLWKALWGFLWTILTIPILCIPALIKQLSYSQMYYIVVENKNISIQKALKISMIITKGHKWDLFVMYLSFIGWAILASMTCGIGYLFLYPYQELTFINAYHYMLQEALENGNLKAEDLTE